MDRIRLQRRDTIEKLSNRALEIETALAIGWTDIHESRSYTENGFLRHWMSPGWPADIVGTRPDGKKYYHIPYYITGLSNLQEIFDYMDLLFENNNIAFEMGNMPNKKWWANIIEPEGQDYFHSTIMIDAKTLNLAVCRAIVELAWMKGNRNERTEIGRISTK